jgi:FdhD protein
MSSLTDGVQILPATRLRGGSWQELDDGLVVEEPLEIRIGGRRYTATMRTPGHDLLLARGLLFAEGVIESNDDIEDMTYRTRCRDLTQELVNVVDITLHDEEGVASHLGERSLISNSSCGLCGKATVDALTAKVTPLPDSQPIPAETLLHLPDKLQSGQTIFAQTGGSHAAGIFNARGEALAIFEDIGRHNATDKAIGCGLEQGWLPHQGEESLILLVSGRASFEILQKALMARIPIVASVSAVSSLAVELAAANNVTLAGFLRPGRLTIYSGESRMKR